MDFIAGVAGERPVLGVCLGLQAIAEFYGGRLYNLKKVLHGVALPTRIRSKEDPLFKGVPDGFTAGRYHSWVADPDYFPENLMITASDEEGRIMAIRHRDLNIAAVQFHPESILTPEGPKILKNWVNSC
jgi:anthranilate synthase component 2